MSGCEYEELGDGENGVQRRKGLGGKKQQVQAGGRDPDGCGGIGHRCSRGGEHAGWLWVGRRPGGGLVVGCGGWECLKVVG